MESSHIRRGGDLCCPLDAAIAGQPGELLYEEMHVVVGWRDNPLFSGALTQTGCSGCSARSGPNSGTRSKAQPLVADRAPFAARINAAFKPLADDDAIQATGLFAFAHAVAHGL